MNGENCFKKNLQQRVAGASSGVHVQGQAAAKDFYSYLQRQ